MTPDLWGDGSVSPTPSWTEERNHLRKRQFELEQEIHRQRVARKWYLIVIVLLYVGLLASFSLNVSLLLRKPQTRVLQPDLLENAATVSAKNTPTASTPAGNQGKGKGAVESKANNLGFAYTTPCLVSVPCDSGEFFDCIFGECRKCPKGTYQPHWGQTSCWPCPANTTTDTTGGSELTQCKRQDCPFYTREGVGIMESPNYPRDYPFGVTCRWRVRPGHTKRVLLILPLLQLPSDCSSKLVVRHQSDIIYTSCSSRQHPLILTGHSSSLWVEFTSGSSVAGLGFQLTALSVEEELGYLVDAVVNSGEITSFDHTDHSSLSQEDKILLSRLLLLLNPTYPASYDGTPHQEPQDRKRKPVIEVLEENNQAN